jgi:hypothetical protein
VKYDAALDVCTSKSVCVLSRQDGAVVLEPTVATDGIELQIICADSTVEPYSGYIRNAVN